MTALYWATVKNGVIEYHSCRTGFEYAIIPERDGFSVSSAKANLNLWTAKRSDAIRLVEMVDLASIANMGERVVPEPKKARGTKNAGDHIIACIDGLLACIEILVKKEG